MEPSASRPALLPGASYPFNLGWALCVSRLEGSGQGQQLGPRPLSWTLSCRLGKKQLSLDIPQGPAFGPSQGSLLKSFP